MKSFFPPVFFFCHCFILKVLGIEANRKQGEGDELQQRSLAGIEPVMLLCVMCGNHLTTRRSRININSLVYRVLLCHAV